MDPKKSIFLRALVHGVSADIRINDVTALHTTGKGIERSTLINRFITHKGANGIKLILDNPEEEVEPGLAAAVRVQIEHEDRTIYQYQWLGVAPAVTLPATIEEEFESPIPLGPWIWQNSMPFEMDDNTYRAVVGLHDRLQRALQRRDLSAVMNLLEIKDRAMARALSISFPTFREQTEGFWNTRFASPGWAMRPLPDSREWIFIHEGNKRVVYSKHQSNADLVSSVPNEDSMFMSWPIYIAKIQLRDTIQWKIVL